VQTGATVVTSKAEEYRAASFDAHNRSVSVRASLPDAARKRLTAAEHWLYRYSPSNPAMRCRMTMQQLTMVAVP
jgi:hypothetical protein